MGVDGVISSLAGPHLAVSKQVGLASWECRLPNISDKLDLKNPDGLISSWSCWLSWPTALLMPGLVAGLVKENSSILSPCFFRQLAEPLTMEV